MEGISDSQEKSLISLDVEDLYDQLKESNKIKEQTNRLEAGLEGRRSKEAKFERELATGIAKSLEKKGHGVAKIASVLSALGILVYYEGGVIDQGQLTEVLPAGQEGDSVLEGNGVDTKVENIKPITTEQREMIIRETGVDIVAIADKANFSVTLDVPSETGKYILHVGQLHYVAKVEEDLNLARGVINVQKDIEKVFLELATKNYTNVFAEGRISEMADILKLAISRVKDATQEVVADEGCFDRLRQLYEEEVRCFTVKNRTVEVLILSRQNLFLKRANELYAELKTKGALTERVNEAYKNLIESINPPGTLSKFGKDAIYIFGSEEKLEWEGVVEVCPAETSEGNKGAFMYDDELERAGKSYFGADFQKMPLETIKSLRDKYERIKSLSDRYVFDVREDIAVQKISESARISPNGAPNLIPLLYGNAHDFSDNIKGHNKTNSIKFGLIRLKPLTTNVTDENSKVRH